ncbi:hypothetical protein ELP03_29700, partial [Klebsiella pneumoniae]|nr:hypothetical protein [Klebsiella pneumoniae]
KACVLPENPASYRVVRTKSYLFNKAISVLCNTVLSTVLGSSLYRFPHPCKLRGLYILSNAYI